MNDDELVARLRAVLHERADGLRPAPGQLPDPTLAAPPAAAPTPAGGVPAGPTPVGATRDHATAEYPVLGASGAAAARGRRRWAPVAGAAAVAAVAATISAIAFTGGSRTVRTGPPPATAPVTSPVPAPATTLPAAPPVSAAPATTAPPAPVAAGFQPFSVTFVSPDEGWALGWAPCSAGYCATLARTTDGGTHWSAATAPALSTPSLDAGATGGLPYFEVRFADPEDGWVYTTGATGAGLASRLWATHDGGRTWHTVPVPLPGATIADLEASGGQAQMVVYGPCAAGSAGCQGQTVVELFSATASGDSWTASSYRPAAGAGPVLSPQLTLWGQSGWLVVDNRTTVSGARLTAGGRWTAWTPPCATANGSGLLAAGSATDLVAVCEEGQWGPPDPGTVAYHTWLFRSTDGGGSFRAVAEVPGSNPTAVTLAPGSGGAIVVADAQLGLLTSHDGGASWSVTRHGVADGTAADPGSYFGFVGFTTSQQGVAVAFKSRPQLLFTRDAGTSWSAASF